MIREEDVQVIVTTTGRHEHYRYVHMPTGVALSDERMQGEGPGQSEFREALFLRLDACVRADRELFG